ncbi:ankyrin repeat-containing domain protein [Xylaria scruposa]|nr:ankyrin repeat-containing domain protein [Xylaria scruposa]
MSINMKHKRSRFSSQQWDGHKACIREWYLEKNGSLKEVQAKLKEQGLDATMHQIETKVRGWNFRKNIDKKTWKSIDCHIAKRKYAGKKSEVILCGRRIKLETVERETDRNGDKSTLAQLALQRSSPAPLIDDQVIVCTPQPINMEFNWPVTLPWLRFSVQELPVIQKACQPWILESQRASSRDLVSAILPKALKKDIAYIGVSKLAAIIGRSMPETYSQENLQRAHNLLSGTTEDCAPECFSVIIYNTSNNAFNFEGDDMWEKSMKVLEACGIFHLKVSIGEDKSPTINGFMEKLFNAAIERCLPCNNFQARDVRAETVIKWILTSGYCLNTAVESLWYRVQNRQVDLSSTQQHILSLTKHLLNAGASANILVPEQNHEEFHTILEIALQKPFSNETIFNLAELLLKHGASKNLDRALHFAIRRNEKVIIEMIVQHTGDLTAGLKPLSKSPLYKETALTVAASVGAEQTSHILDLLCRLYPSINIATFITSDVLIAAAAEGHDDVFRSLYDILPTIPANEYGITPLHMAARYGHLSTCRLVLPLQVAHSTWATAKVSPLQAACYGGHEGVVEFLIRNGADVDAGSNFDSNAEKLRSENQFDIRSNWGRLMPDFFGIPPLQMLLLNELGSSYPDRLRFLRCATILVRAGAKLFGNELSIAAKWCDLELLTAAVAAGANPNGLDGRGKTPLQCALVAKSSRSDELYGFVSYLLSEGAQILGGEVDSAIDLQQWEVVKLLIDHGGNMDRASALKKFILTQDNIRALEIIDSEPSIYDAGALYAAIMMENDALIQRLILNRPSEASEDPFEITAIAVAAMSGNPVLQYLLAHPPACRTGLLPLHYKKQDYECNTYVMVSSVKDIRRGDYSLSTCSTPICGSPLALVASSLGCDALEGCSQLLASGFCADELTWVVAASSQNIAFIQTVLNHGQDGNYSYDDFEDCNPLMIAVGHGNQELVTLLLEAGVNINTCLDGELLSLAAATGDLGVVDCLIQAGVDVNSDSPYNNPLQAAAEEGNMDIVQCLIQAGADVNAEPLEVGGATALQFAAINGHLGLAKYLIEEGAEINAPPSRYGGRTALQGAAEHGRLDMLGFLLAEGALTTGRWRHRFVKAVKLATKERHFTAVDLLKQFAGWSDDDEHWLPRVDVDYDTESEEDELDNLATNDSSSMDVD